MALHQCDVLLLMDFFCFVTLTFLTRHASDLLDGDIIVAIGYVLRQYGYRQIFNLEAFWYFGVDLGGFGVSGLFTQMTR